MRLTGRRVMGAGIVVIFFATGGGKTAVATVASTAAHAAHVAHLDRIPGGKTPAVTSPAAGASTAVSFAESRQGDPYVYGATGPGSFDCSGLMQAAWAAAGVTIPRTSEAQWAQLPHISESQLQPGDLILYTGSPIDPPPGHVTMYIGGGQMVEAYATGTPVRITAVRPGAWGYARP